MSGVAVAFSAVGGRLRRGFTENRDGCQLRGVCRSAKTSAGNKIFAIIVDKPKTYYYLKVIYDVTTEIY
jgi:hypothetical protein